MKLIHIKIVETRYETYATNSLMGAVKFLNDRPEDEKAVISNFEVSKDSKYQYIVTFEIDKVVRNYEVE